MAVFASVWKRRQKTKVYLELLRYFNRINKPLASTAATSNMATLRKYWMASNDNPGLEDEEAVGGVGYKVIKHRSIKGGKACLAHCTAC